MKTCFLALSLVASLGMAQTSTTNPQPPQRRMHRPGGDPEQMFEQHLASRLSLNATQQNAVHTAMMESRTQMKGMFEQMQTLRTQMNAAIKAGNTDQIDAVSQQMATLHQQELSIRGKTTMKIYSTLTADQKAKVGNRIEMLGGPGGMGFGPGFGPGRRPGPPAQNSSNQ